MDHPDDPAAPTTMVPTSPQDLVQHLRGSEGQLTEAVRRPLVAAGASILPALIALVEDALADDQPEWGWAPLHAIDLLGAVGDARALPVLLRCLDLEDELDLRLEQAEAALRALGARALEGCVAAYAAAPRDAVRDRLAGVMSQWGLHDERIYAALLDTLQRTPELGANYLVDYGDPRALAVLAQTFDTLPIREGDNLLANHVFIELRCAIEDLGGQLTAAQQHKFAQADAPDAGSSRSSPGTSRRQPSPPGARRLSHAPLPRDHARLPRGSASWAGTPPVGVGVGRSTRSAISP